MMYLKSTFKIGEVVTVYLGPFGKNTAQPVTELASVTGVEFYSVANDMIKCANNQNEIDKLANSGNFDGLRYEVRMSDRTIKYFAGRDIGKL